MAYTCGSSIYVSLHVSGVYTTIHIRQHTDNVDEATGKTQINRDGLFLTTDEFSSLLYQLNAIEKSFTNEQNDNASKCYTPSSLSKRKLSIDADQSAMVTPPCKVSKKDDSIKQWYASKVKSIIENKLKEDCFSCLMELPDSHICQTHVNDASHKYLEKFFNSVVDDIDIKLAIADLNLSTSKSRTITSLVKRKSWRQAVQSIIIQNKTD